MFKDGKTIWEKIKRYIPYIYKSLKDYNYITRKR